MQALRVHAFDQPLQLGTLPVPEPAAGQVRVRVQACGISFFDLLIACGGYQWRPGLPFTVGSEFAGVVDALGPGTTGLAVGDRVGGSVSIGAWCQQLCVPADALHPVAPQAALQTIARLQPGETLLVLGATGTVGAAAVQLGKALGARVIGGATGAAKCAAVRAAGADAVVDLGADDWKDQVKALAGPQGVDVVADPVGGAATDTAFRTLGWGGRHLVLGFASGSIGQLKGNLTIVKGASLVGVDLRQFKERQPDAARVLMQDVAALHRGGRIQPLITSRWPLAQHAQACAQAGDRATVGRVLLLP